MHVSAKSYALYTSATGMRDISGRTLKHAVSVISGIYKSLNFTTMLHHAIMLIKEMDQRTRPERRLAHFQA